MTYVQYINCDKWKKIIGITLWVGATIGLIIGLYFCIEYFLNPVTLPKEPDTSLPDDEYNKELHVYIEKENEYIQYIENIGFYQFNLILVFCANIANTCLIWYALNHHYEWIELRCGVKQSPNEVAGQ